MINRATIEKWREALPARMAALVFSPDVWVVGSQAARLTQGKMFAADKDWDLLVQIQGWDHAARYIPRSAAINGRKGWKFQSFGFKIDMWPDMIDRYFAEAVDVKAREVGHSVVVHAVSLSRGLCLSASKAEVFDGSQSTRRAGKAPSRKRKSRRND